MMETEFQHLQRAFAAHIRAPGQHTRPQQVDERRMRVYRELVHSTVSGLVENAFPVLRGILGEERWAALMRAFVAQHVCSTPLFHEVPGELVAFLEAGEGLPQGLPDFTTELAHYEWVELALAVDPAEAEPALADPNGDLLAGVPVLSPLAWPLAYRYPVHRIAPEFQPEAPPEQPSWLLAHRTRGDEVRFNVLNAVSARLIALIATAPAPGRTLLEGIAAEAGHADSAPIVAEGAKQLRAWREADILLGTRHAEPARNIPGEDS